MIGDTLQYFTAYKPITSYIVSLIRSEKITNQRFCIAVSGESGCGKTSLAYSLKVDIETLSDYKGIIFHQDDYFKLPPKDNHNNRLKSLDNVGLHEVDLQLLDDHIKNFKQNSGPLKKPLVDYLQNQINSETIEIQDFDFCIVEGTYVGNLSQADYQVFMSMDYLRSRKQREDRARDIMDEFNEKVLKKEHDIIKKQADEANLIVDSELRMIPNTL